MTRLGVPVALDTCTPGPVREFFLPRREDTLARVREAGMWKEVVLLLVPVVVVVVVVAVVAPAAALAPATASATPSWPEVYEDRLAHDWDFFSLMLPEAAAAADASPPSGEAPPSLPPSPQPPPPSDGSFLEPFRFDEAATMRFHGNELMMEGRLRLLEAEGSLAFLLFCTAV